MRRAAFLFRIGFLLPNFGDFTLLHYHSLALLLSAEDVSPISWRLKPRISLIFESWLRLMLSHFCGHGGGGDDSGWRVLPASPSAALAAAAAPAAASSQQP
jgi:hypothetical protein